MHDDIRRFDPPERAQGQKFGIAGPGADDADATRRPRLRAVRADCNDSLLIGPLIGHGRGSLRVSKAISSSATGFVNEPRKEMMN
jgi:hypothetical protein